jgi:hypothetical protein
MLIEGNLDGAIVALTTAFEQTRSQAMEVGKSGEKVRRPSKLARPGAPAAILESLCMCLAKKGDWSGVHEYCNLALDSPGLRQQLSEEKKVKLLTRRSMAKACMLGDEALDQPYLERMRTDLQVALEVKPCDRTSRTGLRHIAFLESQVDAAASLADGRLGEEQPGGLARLRAMAA